MKNIFSTMHIQVCLFMILIATFVQAKAVASARGDGSLLDSLIAQGLSYNDLKVIERAITDKYGPPTSYNSPSASESTVTYSGAVPVGTVSNVGFSAGGTITPEGIIRPQVEILKLLENLLVLKGEIVPRIYAMAVDNWDLIQSVFYTVVNNAGPLHAFTLKGIVILRKILEFAVQLFGSWQITVPNVSLDFSSLLREGNYNL
ncbi:hypothetical protein WA026_002291 [Henosepilachna vigintioctopunctata]|uniref:Uncharacterized protein n=1 Tax=Henosepilachna vigintioctopunctata TaxID=420089 RepID=A0AAW1TUH4_9CUCU